MKKFLQNFLYTKEIVIVLTVSVLTAVGFNSLTAKINNAVYAQEENNTVEKVPVVTYYLNDKLKLKHKEKVIHQSIKDPATGKETGSIHTQYGPNGNIRFIEEYQYDLNTGNKIRLSVKAYFEDGKIMQENEYGFDPNTDNMTSQIQTAYRANGEKSYIKEFHYSSEWKMPTSEFNTDYYNGKIFSKTEDYWDVNTHNKIHSVSVMYNHEAGNILQKNEYNYAKETGDMISKTQAQYYPNGNLYYLMEWSYVPDSDVPTCSISTYYDEEGNITSKEETKYNIKTGDKIISNYKQYDSNGNISHKEESSY